MIDRTIDQTALDDFIEAAAAKNVLPLQTQSFDDTNYRVRLNGQHGNWATNEAVISPTAPISKADLSFKDAVQLGAQGRQAGLNVDLLLDNIGLIRVRQYGIESVTVNLVFSGDQTLSALKKAGIHVQ